MKKAKSVLSLLLALLMVFGCVATASAAEAAVESEQNGEIATADTMTAGSKITGNLQELADVDYFVFIPAKTGLATITLEHAAVSGAAEAATYFAVSVVRVVDGTEKEITSFTSAGASKSDASAAFGVDAGAKYYVKVSAGQVYDATLDYSLSVAVNTDLLTEKEPNDSADKASALEYSVSGSAKHYYGTITEGDLDCYSFTIPSAGVVYAYLYNDTVSAGDYTATLYTYAEDTNGTEMLKPVASIAIGADESSKMSTGIGLAAGSYILIVKGVDDSTGSYRTRVFYSKVDNAEKEINDDKATATAITLGKEMQATLDAKGDTDYFKVTVPANNKGYDIAFTIDSAAAANAGIWKVLVTDANNGVVVAESLVTSEKAGAFETKSLDAGTYYIRVVSGDTLNTGIYRIKMTEKAKADDNDDSEKTLWERIQALNWGAFLENFTGWIEQINFEAIIKSITSSIATVITYLSALG